MRFRQVLVAAVAAIALFPCLRAWAQEEADTEDFILAGIKAVAEKHKLDPRRIFTFSWSSGGWAAWHASFLKEIRGSFIAMAVFYPEQLPPLAQARGRAYHLYHSPEDDVCKFPMAEAARDALTRNGALVFSVEAAAAPPRVVVQARGSDATVHRQIACQKEKGLPLRGFSPPWLDP